MKRCPFCGGDMEGQPSGVSASNTECIGYFICLNCDIKITIFRKTYAEILEAWDKRAIEGELIEALEEIEEKVLSQYELRSSDLAVWRRVEEAIEKARGK